jgi:hypothetical protein
MNNSRAKGNVEKLEEGYNWKAFFFGPLWFLSKGMGNQALFYLMFVYLFYSGSGFSGLIILAVITGFVANKDHKKYLLEKGYKIKIVKKYKNSSDKILWILGFLVLLLLIKILF